MTASPVFGKVYMASQLTDAFARKFYYLRLSITDVQLPLHLLPAERLQARRRQ